MPRDRVEPLHRQGMRVLAQAWMPRRDEDEPCAERFKPVVVNYDYPRAKPKTGGLWTSTYHDEHGSDWVQWCLSEEFECDRSDPTFPLWTLEPEPVVRVYTIDTYGDLAQLVDEYPHRKHFPDRGYGAWSDAKPNWGAIAKDFDGVRLTRHGQSETRLTHPLDLYGWDCESTLWFRWAFTETRYLGPVRCKAEDPWWEEAVA